MILLYFASKKPFFAGRQIGELYFSVCLCVGGGAFLSCLWSWQGFVLSRSRQFVGNSQQTAQTSHNPSNTAEHVQSVKTNTTNADPTCAAEHVFTFLTWTFIHLADAFIQTIGASQTKSFCMKACFKHRVKEKVTFISQFRFVRCLLAILKRKVWILRLIYNLYMKSSFPKRYKSILIVFMKMTLFYLDPYILLILHLSC